MGGNAQRKRAEKAEHKSTLRLVPRRAGKTTKTMARLREKMAQVVTRAQFERIILTTAPENRGRMRAMLEPMLPPDLPCCATWAVRAAERVDITRPYDDTGEPEHCLGCPTRKAVVH